MKSSFIAWTIVVIVLAIAAILGVFILMPSPASAPSAPPPSETSTDIATSSSPALSATYMCEGGKRITATYQSSSVALSLSDGRTLTLSQATSASGVRYENGTNVSTSDIFVNKGANAFFTENGSTTYANCIENASSGVVGPNASTSVFTDQGHTFSFNYPSQFSVTGGAISYTRKWMQNSTSSGLILAQLSIPSSFASGTNFGGATFTIGTSPAPAAVANCLTVTGGAAASSTQISINGTPFTKLSYPEAAAGNRYQIVSYRTVRNNQCYAMEYVIHSHDLRNYSRGSVTSFPSSTIDDIMNGIAQSFRFL